MPAKQTTDMPDLDKVLKQTIVIIEQGKLQIFEIADATSKEVRKIETELVSIKGEVADTIVEVDHLETLSKRSRVRLMEVSKNFHTFGEAEVKQAYEKAQDYQVRLAVAREREKYLRHRRDELELRLKGLSQTVEKAEGLATSIGVAVDFLKGNLKDVSSQLEGLQQRHLMGIQVIKAQEEERKRVAREIHDGPAQAMANVVFRVEVCQKLLENDISQARAELKETKDLVRGCLQEVRRIIFDLRPMALDDLGLAPAMRRYIENFREKVGLSVDLVVRGEERRFTPAVEVATFRMVQEALSNIHKHAQATKVTVLFNFGSDRFQGVVQDNGVGFDMEEVKTNGIKRDSFGLVSMSERAALFDGVVEVDSKQGQGTRVTIQFPFSGEREEAAHDPSDAGR